MSALTADMYIKLKYMHVVCICMGMRGVYRTCVVLHIVGPRSDVELTHEVINVFRDIYDSSVTYRYEYVDDLEICFAPRDAHVANRLIKFFKTIYKTVLGQVYIMMNV